MNSKLNSGLGKNIRYIKKLFFYHELVNAGSETQTPTFSHNVRVNTKMIFKGVKK